MNLKGRSLYLAVIVRLGSRRQNSIFLDLESQPHFVLLYIQDTEPCRILCICYQLWQGAIKYYIILTLFLTHWHIYSLNSREVCTRNDVPGPHKDLSSHYTQSWVQNRKNIRETIIRLYLAPLQGLAKILNSMVIKYALLLATPGKWMLYTRLLGCMISEIIH